MRTPVCVLIAAAVLSTALPAKADPGDPAGWFVNLDRRGRAFLTWTPRKDGPRILMLACLRDAELFTVMSAAVGDRDEWKRAQLLLSDGRANFSVDGEVTFYPHSGRSAFIADLDADRDKMRELGGRLLPVLQGDGALALMISRADGPDILATTTIPKKGLDTALPRFRQVCF